MLLNLSRYNSLTSQVHSDYLTNRVLGSFASWFLLETVSFVTIQCSLCWSFNAVLELCFNQMLS